MDVFISYRRDGGFTLARLLYEYLHKESISAFLDLEELRAGPFNEKLYDAIEHAENFVLVLPPNALDRCVSENDWLRLEIEHAIKHKKNIIPLPIKAVYALHRPLCIIHPVLRIIRSYIFRDYAQFAVQQPDTFSNRNDPSIYRVIPACQIRSLSTRHFQSWSLNIILPCSAFGKFDSASATGRPPTE